MTKPAPVLGMVLKGYPRISETFISNEILLLEELGFKVHIISMRRPREDFTHESVTRIKARVDYLPSTIRGNFTRLASGTIKACMRSPGNALKAIKLLFSRLKRSRSAATFKHFLQGGYTAGSLLPGSGVTHLHAHFAHSPTSVAMFTAAFAGLPFSFTGHAKDVWTQAPDKLAEKLAMAKFAVTCTQYNAVYLSKLAKGRTEVHRVYHGIDLSLFNGDHPARAKEAPAAPYRLITVARFTAKKGLATVIEALILLKEDGIDFTWTIIGDGEERDATLALAHERGLGNRVDWLGTQPHERVVEELGKSHLFVLGCRVTENGDRDGIPNVLVEAMAMGLPVVATTVSGIPELVENEKTGLLAPPQNPAALAEAVKRLLTDHPLRLSLIPAAKQKVHADFDNKLLIRTLARIYAEKALGVPLDWPKPSAS